MNEEFDRFEEHMANQEVDPYEVFSNQMETSFPKMFAEPYGGFAVGEGWWPIIGALCSQIQQHIDWANGTRARLLKDNPYNHNIPNEVVQVTVNQIKEKFGGLRFYYSGGDDMIDGMVRMAESWAARACETCGSPATSGGRGWITTLCPTHRAEADAKYAERFKE